MARPASSPAGLVFVAVATALLLPAGWTAWERLGLADRPFVALGPAALVGALVLWPFAGSLFVLFALPFFGNHPGGRYMELLNLPVAACALGLAIRAYRLGRPTPRGPLWRAAAFYLAAATVALVPVLPGLLVRAAQVNDLALTLDQALTCPEWDALYPAGAYLQLVFAISWAHALAWAGADLVFARRALAVLAAGVVGVALLGALHYHGLVNLHQAYLVRIDPNLFFRDRFQSIFWNPSWLAIYFTFAYGLSLGLLGPDEPARRRLAVGILLAFAYAYFLLNRQRGGFLALHAALLVLAATMLATTRRPRWRLALLAGAAVLLAGIAVPLVLPDHRGASGLGRVLVETGVDENRRKLWLTAVAMWKSAPLFGIGEGAFASRYREFVPEGSPLDSPFYGDAHNTWLNILATQGLVGLLAFGCLVLLALREVVRRLRAGGPERGVAAGLACGLAAFLTYSLFQAMFYLQSVRVLFWGSLALLAAITPAPAEPDRPGRAWRWALLALVALGLVAQVRQSRPLFRAAEAELARQPRGFYPLERRSGVPVRWSSLRGTLCLYPTGRAMALRVIPGSRPPGRLPVQVTLRVGERVVDRFQIPTRAAVDRTIDLPEAVGFRAPALPAPFGECLPNRLAIPFSVEVDSQWSPMADGQEEYRHLGVALSPPVFSAR